MNFSVYIITQKASIINMVNVKESLPSLLNCSIEAENRFCPQAALCPHMDGGVSGQDTCPQEGDSPAVQRASMGFGIGRQVVRSAVLYT